MSLSLKYTNTLLEQIRDELKAMNARKSLLDIEVSERSKRIEDRISNIANEAVAQTDRRWLTGLRRPKKETNNAG